MQQVQDQVTQEIESRFSAWQRSLEESDTKIRTLVLETEEKVQGIGEQADQSLITLEEKMSELSQHTTATVESRLREWQQSLEAVDIKTQALLAESEERIYDLEEYARKSTITIEKKIEETAYYAQEQVKRDAEHNLAVWQKTFEEEGSKNQLRLAESNERIHELEQDIDAIEEQIAEAVQKAHQDADLELKRWQAVTNQVSTQSQQALTRWEKAFEGTEERIQGLKNRADEASSALEQKVQQDAIALEKRWSEVLRKTEQTLQLDFAAMQAHNSTVEQELSEQITKMERHFAEVRDALTTEIFNREPQLRKAADDMEQKILEETSVKFDEYRLAQMQQFKRLETVADDMALLESELNIYLQDTENRVREDFSQFERDLVGARDAAFNEFNTTTTMLMSDLERIEHEVEELKNQAYEHASSQLDDFKDDFTRNLIKQNKEIDSSIHQWQETVQEKLKNLGEETVSQRYVIEQVHQEELKNMLTAHSEHISLELEHLKTRTTDFENEIVAQMKNADESLRFFSSQLNVDMKDLRDSTELQMKEEFTRYNTSMSHLLDLDQQDIEHKMSRISEVVKDRDSAITELLEESQRNIENWQSQLSNQVQDLRTVIDEAHRSVQSIEATHDEQLAAVQLAIQTIYEESNAHKIELFTRTEEQLAILNRKIEESNRHIQEFSEQVKVFDKTDELREELERRLAEFRDDFEHLEQHRAEVAEVESQFTKIKRLEDEVNAKMTKFFSEKHRIEQMEGDFDRLVQTAKAIEDKLVHISTSDDTLQNVQLQIRQLNDALKDAEDKYQRIEKKNQILDTTNDGIDRNFQELQENERQTQVITKELQKVGDNIGSLRETLNALSNKYEQLHEITGKLSILDSSLSDVESRIQRMDESREWLARTETQLTNLYKQAQDQVKLATNILKSGKDPITREVKGAPPIGVRETIIKLSQQGWSIDEIARAVKYSKGEVELILEIARRGD
ncbi:hypothetical protein PilKf_01898 [Pillotina sp. SPG140]